MKRLAGAALIGAFISTTALASSEDPGVYVEGGGVVSFVSEEADVVVPGTGTVNVDLDASPISLLIRAGYLINPFFAIEIDGLIGILEDEIDTNFGPSGADLGVDYAVGGFLRGRYPINENASIHARAGFMNAQISADIPGYGSIESDDDTAPAFGVGGSIHLNDKASIRADYTYADFELAESHNLGVTVGYKLGKLSQQSRPTPTASTYEYGQGNTLLRGRIGAGVEVRVGVEFPVAGEVTSGLVTDPFHLESFSTGFDMRQGQVQLRAQDWNDAYENFITVGVALSRDLSKTRELFVEASYSRADGQTVDDFGTLTFIPDQNDPTLNQTVGLSAQFDDYESFGLDAGLRWKFLPDRPVQPYIGGRIGAEFIKAAALDITAATDSVSLPPDVGRGTAALTYTGDVTAADVPLFNDSAVLTGGIDFGVVYEPSDRLQLALESGFHVTGRLDGGEPIAVLSEINNDSSRFSIPLMVRGRLLF